MGKFKFNMKLSHKLWIVTLVFLVPVSTLIYNVMTRVHSNIDFAAQEKLGNTYQRPLEGLLKAVGEHRLETHLSRLLETQSDRLPELVREIDSELSQVVKVQEANRSEIYQRGA